MTKMAHLILSKVQLKMKECLCLIELMTTFHCRLDTQQTAREFDSNGILMMNEKRRRNEGGEAYELVP